MPPKLASKSPAQFFAEHQNIAGFDNAGKSLYTTIREFVENALDASEAASRLPSIELRLEHLDEKQFAELRGVNAHKRSDASLYVTKKLGKKRAREEEAEEKEGVSASADFFTVSCKDNGTGMPHERIPSMLGIVLSSTKYGVRQSRGKFGLGAKMALVWSKKSTGMPVEVYSSEDGEYISYCKLDIDIYKNAPHILQHQKLPNPDSWIGTEISITIEGKWTQYKSKILSYLRQLAIITPYAEIEFRYIRKGNESKNLFIEFCRRTDKMPEPAAEVKHHPSAVDNLLVESLINTTSKKRLDKFLSGEFSNLSLPLAKRLIAELGGDFTPESLVKQLSKKQIHQITRLLREAKFPPPTGSCLSPAGEYNLRLGIFKELQPDLVSTAISQPRVFEGHPFIVEAGVAIGGKIQKVGVSVYRFANRIPLLFEAGSDVSTRVSNLKIKWSYYKIRQKIDKIAVFVSIVSTKIPFKSSSKEYIGDDKEGGIIHETVKDVIQKCCLQLKTKIGVQSTLKEKQERKKNISRYIPDVSRAVFGLLSIMEDPSQESPDKDPHVDGSLVTLRDLRSKLEEYVAKIDQASVLEDMRSSGRKRGEDDRLFLCGIEEQEQQLLPPIRHPTAHFSLELLL